MTTTEQNEILRLRDENEKLRKQAMAYASYGDILKTVALLPLSTDLKYEWFEDRVKVALMMHGIEPESPGGQKIIDGFIATVSADRERLIRAFTEAKHGRQRGGSPAVTPGCPCVMCSGIIAAEQIIVAEPSRKSDTAEIEETLRKDDYYLTKVGQKRLTTEDRDRAREKISGLLGLFRDMGVTRSPLSALNGLLEKILGLGPKDSARGGVQILSVGPNGIEDISSKFPDRG